MKQVMKHRSTPAWAPQASKQQGFTLVELMVALALSLLVVAASISALLVSRQGFTTLDTAAQLRDNARFATDFITRLSVQSGFKDVAFVDTASQNAFTAKGVATDPAPPISGFNNAVAGTATDPLNTTDGSRAAKCTDSTNTACANGSDILVVRYQVGAKNTDSPLGGGAADVDNAMFNCAGAKQTKAAASSTDVIENMLYVDISATSGEPTLMCKYRTGVGEAWAEAGVPLVSGVESFQVLYGTDGVVPNTIPVARAALGATLTAGQPDSIPDRYLSADKLTVAGDTEATNENWRRVRSLRIGLVLRGAPGSVQEAIERTYYPFAPYGSKKVTPAKFTDAQLTIPAADTRVRQVVTFTIYLHNYQGV